MGSDASCRGASASRLAMPELVQHIQKIRTEGEKTPVLVAFCFSDELPLKACLAGCQAAGAVPVIMATFNQVNTDGGYSGLTAGEFVRRVMRLAAEAGYDGPLVFGRDHGGPFIIEARKQYSRQAEMQWVKKNITCDLEAGFSCWHADGTSGRDDELVDGKLPVEEIADATLDLIRFCESERKRLGIGPIAYEVGSEEQQGGLTAPDSFERYLQLMDQGMQGAGLEEAGLDFVVAQTGTHMKLYYESARRQFELIQDGFKPGQVDILDRIAARYRSPRHTLLFTQHYSDHVSPADAVALRRFGAGKVNFGPEMTMPELKQLLDWDKMEREALQKSGRESEAAGFRAVLLEHLDRRPDFWQKFMPADPEVSGAGGNPSVFDLSPDVQDALLVFRGRYVKSRPRCREAARKLLENAAALGFDPDPEATIIEAIKARIILPRLKQFHMVGLRYTLPE